MKGVIAISTVGMSLEMYNFIIENEGRLQYDLVKGIVITPRGTNGTLCSSTGYLRVRVNKKTLQVHQILAVKYFGESCIGMQINHKDGNKTNNKKDNLEVVTQRENINHGYKNGLYDNAIKRFKEMRKELKGELTFNSKLTDDDVRYIRNSSDSHASLSRRFKVDPATIRSIRKYETWKHVI